MIKQFCSLVGFCALSAGVAHGQAAPRAALSSTIGHQLASRPTGMAKAAPAQLALADASVLPGTPTGSPAKIALEGIWKGAVPAQGGSLDLSFSLVALSSGKYFAALDVPAQKLSRVAVEVEQTPDSVRLLVPSIKARLLARLSPGGTELRGTWSRPGHTSPVVLEHTPMPSAVGPTSRMAPPYQEEDVKVSNYQARLKLGGTFTAPPGAGPYPAVVLISDVGEQNRDGQAADNPGDFRLLGALADYLTRHGFAVLRLDDRGVGQSEGRNSQATPTQRAGDVTAALNYLRTRPEVDMLHLGLIGHGEGANIAMLVAAQPLPPAFVVGLGAYGLTGYQTQLNQLEASLVAEKLPAAQQATLLQREGTMLDLIRYSTNLGQTQTIITNLLRQGDATITPAAAQLISSSLLTPWNRAYLSFDPLESLPQVQCPVLLLTGQDDQLAPAADHMQQLERELKANGNRNVTAQRVPHVNHQLEPPQIQWTMIDGEMKPVLAPTVVIALEQWLTQQVTGAKKK